MSQQYAIVCYQAGAAPSGDIELGVQGAGSALVCSGVAGADGSMAVAYLEAQTSGSDEPVSGGAEAGMLIGGAVFGVLAVAFGLRTLRRFIDSSSEG